MLITRTFLWLSAAAEADVPWIHRDCERGGAERGVRTMCVARRAESGTAVTAAFEWRARRVVESAAAAANEEENESEARGGKRDGIGRLGLG